MDSIGSLKEISQAFLVSTFCLHLALVPDFWIELLPPRFHIHFL